MSIHWACSDCSERVVHWEENFGQLVLAAVSLKSDRDRTYNHQTRFMGLKNKQKSYAHSFLEDIFLSDT